MSTGSSLPAMSNDAFAGFLRLLLTPLSETPEMSAEVRAYLAFLSKSYPAELRRAEFARLREPAGHAA